MKQGQKIIKYLAIILAISLIFNIISISVYGIISITNLFDNKEITSIKGEATNIKENIKDIYIDVANTKIIIEESANFKLETNNEYITIRENNNKLSITEKKRSIFKYNEDTELIIYIPRSNIFNNVFIETGAGEVHIDKLNTQNLELELGAGKVNINNLKVTYNTNIDGGAGEIVIKNSNLNNIDLDMGVGKIKLNASLTGNADIDAGVGGIELDLIDSLDNYKIKVDKGLGNVTLNEETINSNTYYGTGLNNIDIDGGVGTINITTKN